MFLDKLNTLLEKKGINKHTLSKESGIPYTTIMSWYQRPETVLHMKLSTVKKLSSYLKIPIDDLCENIFYDPNESSSVEIQPKNRLEALRRRKGLSVSDLAEYLNCTPLDIALYEASLKPLSQAALKKLSALYQKSIDYLLGPAGPLDVFGLPDSLQKEPSPTKEESSCQTVSLLLPPDASYLIIKKEEGPILWAFLELLRNYQENSN